MKDVLSHCANLAHIDLPQVNELEADFVNMIKLADKINELDLAEEMDVTSLCLDKFRDDKAVQNSYENLFGNAKNVVDGMICVPKLDGCGE